MTASDYNEHLIAITARLKQLDMLLDTLNDQRGLLLDEFAKAKKEYDAQKEN